VPEENNTDERDDNAFFDQFFAQGCDGAANQAAPIVSRDHGRAGGQRWFDFGQLALDAVDHAQCIFAVAHHHDPTDDFAFAVELGETAPKGGPEMDVRDVLDVDRRAVHHLEDDALDVVDAFDIAAAADVILGAGNFKSLAAYVGVTGLDSPNDFAERNAVSRERIGIEVDLIFLYKSADRR